MPQKRAVTLLFQTRGIRIEIDCTLSLEPQYNAEVTRYPTEKGNPVTDHRDIQPDMLVLSGVMSDVHPYRSNNPEGFDPFGPVPYNPNDTGFHTNFRDVLIEAHRTSELITVEAGKRGTWTDMLLLPFSLPSTPENGASVFFSLSLIELVITETDVKKLTEDKPLVPANTAANQALIAADGGGNQPTINVAGAQVTATPDTAMRHSPLQKQGLVTPQAANVREQLTTPFNGAQAVGEWAR